MMGMDGGGEDEEKYESSTGKIEWKQEFGLEVNIPIRNFCFLFLF